MGWVDAYVVGIVSQYAYLHDVGYSRFLRPSLFPDITAEPSPQPFSPTAQVVFMFAIPKYPSQPRMAIGSDLPL